MIDQSGQQFAVVYNQATQAEKDNLWKRLAIYAHDLQTQMKTHFKNEGFHEHDLDLIGTERYACLFPTLLQNDGQLRIRKQQEDHTQNKEAAVPAYLRKIERAASELSDGIKMSSSYKPSMTTQEEVHKRLLELPDAKHTVTWVEHNLILLARVMAWSVTTIWVVTVAAKVAAKVVATVVVIVVMESGSSSTRPYSYFISQRTRTETCRRNQHKKNTQKHNALSKTQFQD